MTDRARARWIGALVATLTGALYATFTILQHRRFAIVSYDNAIYEQAIKGYANLDAPRIDILHPGLNQLGDHFAPLLVVLAPIYRVFPSAQTILLEQVALVALSVAVITTLAVRYAGVVWGTTIGVAYGLSFGLQSGIEATFHDVVLAVPLLALAGAAYVDRRHRAVVLWSLPLILVKEDQGLTVAAVGAVLWLANERRKGAVLVVVGVVATAVTLLVLIPAFNIRGGYSHTQGFSAGQAVLDAMLDGTGRKLATLVLTIGITGMVAVFSPWVLLALPTLGWRFASGTPSFWGTEWHYSLVLMPIVFVAMIDAIRRHPQL